MEGNRRKDGLKLSFEEGLMKVHDELKDELAKINDGDRESEMRTIGGVGLPPADKNQMAATPLEEFEAEERESNLDDAEKVRM